MAQLSDLIQALWAGDLPRVSALLHENPKLAAERPATGPTALLVAAYTRNPALIAELRKYAPCDACEAAALGDVSALETLLDARPADIALYSGDGWTPLHLAAFFGHESVVLYLLSRSASPAVRSKGPEANYPLHAAIAGADAWPVIEALLNAGADPSATAASDIRPLHIAASRGDRRTVDALLARGADRQHQTTDGRTAAALATERKFPELAEFLALSE